MTSPNLSVTKRDGSAQQFDQAKIERLNVFTTKGLNVDLGLLKKQIHFLMFDGMSTADIFQAQIKAAAGLISQVNPDFTFVAARYLLADTYKRATGQAFYPSLNSIITRGIAAGRYDGGLDVLFDHSALDAAIKPERDFQFDYFGLQNIVDRYLARDDRANLIELPQHFFMRVAMGLALKEDNPTERAIEFYEALSSFDMMCSTPTLFNAGTRHSQLSSCYLNTVADQISSDEGEDRFASIFGTIEESARLSKFAGGIGTDWTRVRGGGSHIKSTNGKSSGVIPYLKIYSDTAVAVNQCFAPDTLVFCAGGTKRIADIEIGDLVLTERGQHRKVLEALAYEQGDGPMVSIDIKHSTQPLIVTSGHPIFAVAGAAAEQSIERTLTQLASGKIAAKWIDAGNLCRYDYVAQTIPTEVAPIGGGFSDDDARLYGIMLGDGSCCIAKRQWSVSGHPTKSSIAFVQAWLTKRGFNFWENADGNKLQISWSYGGEKLAQDLAGRFLPSHNCLPFEPEDLYDANRVKRIEARFTHLPLSQALAMLRGLIETDGNISRGVEVTFCNTSRSLIEGVRYQLLRFGVPSATNRTERSNAHLGSDTTTVAWNLRIPAAPAIASAFGVPPLTKFNWFVYQGHIFTRIIEAKPVETCPIVHDLRIDGIESYLTTSALAHNGGKRKGSFAPYLEVWHPDFWDFCELKKEFGDERLRAHDIFPAAWIADLFMKRVEANGLWSTFQPNKYPELHELYGDAFEARYITLETEGKFESQRPAVEVWKHILTNLFETGQPWITFKDECNRRNPQDHVGVIHSSNLCTEICLNTSDTETAVCNLASINLARHVKNGYLDINKLAITTITAMRMLDNVIDLNFYPSERARTSNMKHRPVGLGIMGETEAKVACGIAFDSEQGVQFSNDAMEFISFVAIGASCDLAGQRGAYPSFVGSKWSKGILPRDSWTGVSHKGFVSAASWSSLTELVKHIGMRNSNTMAIAPTATISIICGTTPCNEPIFEIERSEKNMSATFLVIDPCVKYGRPDLLKTVWEIAPEWIIRSAAARQRWIDQSQSINIFVPNGMKGRDLAAIYMLAWKLKLKTTYYLRSQSKTAKVIATPSKSTIEQPESANFCSIDQPDCEACQ